MQKQLVLGLNKKVEYSVFEKYLKIARLTSYYDPNQRVWYIDPLKLQVVDKIQLKIAIDTFEQTVGRDVLIQPEVIDYLKEYVKDIKIPSNNNVVVIDKLYFIYNFGKDLRFLDYLKSRFSKTVKRYDYREGRFTDAQLQFYEVKYTTFMAHRGLLPLFIDVYKSYYSTEPRVENPYNLKIKDISIPSEIAGFKLRDYQIKAIENSLYHISLFGGALIQLPTGAGKTITGLSLAKLLYDNGFIKNGMVLVNSIDLANQWYSISNKFFESVGIYTGDSKSIKDFTIATMQSVYRKVNSGSELIQDGINGFLKNADFIIFDEVHHLPADTFKQVASLNSNIHVGLSATPWRDDQLDEIIYGLTSIPSIRLKFSDLKDYLVTPTVVNVFIDFADFVDVNSDEESDEFEHVSRKYMKKTLQLLHDEKIHRFVVWLANKSPIKPVIIHSPFESVARVISETYNIPLLSGKISGVERTSILEGLRSSKISIAISTTVIDEGVDIPNLSVLIEIFPGSSLVKTVQRIGRLVRKSPGKDKAYAFLFVYKVKSDRWYNEIMERQYYKRKAILDYEEGWKKIDLYYSDVLKAFQ